VTSAQLRRRAEARGVTTAYRDWQGRRIQVGDETLRAVLAALGSAPPPAHPRTGVSGGRPAVAAPWHPADHPAAPAVPRPSWGFTVQLYSVRSRLSWGHGDLRDLAALAAWSASALGAGFVLINPLHAAEPLPPLSPSPYLPMSRRFLSPLYLRVEDIPEYSLLPPAQRERIAALAAPLRARNSTSALIDRDAVWTAKRAALELVHAWPLSPARRAAFRRFTVREGQALEDWVTWCALAETHGPDWRAWPAALRAPRSAAVTAKRERLRAVTGFHAWLQWLAHEQRAAAQEAARAAGMSIGVISDLAVGAHPGGADAWAHQDVLAPGMSVGAPPDEFNPRGQDWTLPPWHPARLEDAGYQPLADLIRAGFTDAGGLRADHVLGLFRLWWVPEGMTADQGTYVRYRHEAMVGLLTGEAARSGGIAIGEDLGTVDAWMRDYLAARRVLGTSMLWFERRAGGTPLPPRRWRRDCLATVGTHDVPPAAAFLTGEHVALRSRLGLLTGSPDDERRRAADALSAWLDALAGQGLIQPGTPLGPAEFTRALYGYLARTPAALIGVSLTDAVGDRRPQNLPGTTDQYPNWRIPLCDGQGRAVLLEDLDNRPGVRDLADAVSQRNAASQRNGVSQRPGGPAPGSAARGGARPGPR
jgi:4-alpha-glucanotransferase